MFLTQKVPLPAGIDVQLPGGTFFYLRASAGPIDVKFLINGTERGKAGTVEQGFSYDTGGVPFDAVILNSPTAQTVTADIATGRIKNTSVAANVDATVVQATQANAPESVAVGTAAVPVLSDASAKLVIFKNTGTTHIYLGGAGVTTASPIELAPGDVWIEDRAAQVAWYAIGDAAGGTLSAMSFD